MFRSTSLRLAALYTAAFALSVYATGAAVLAGRRHDRRLMQSAGNAVMAAFGTVLVAVVAAILLIARERIEYFTGWDPYPFL